MRIETLGQLSEIKTAVYYLWDDLKKAPNCNKSLYPPLTNTTADRLQVPRGVPNYRVSTQAIGDETLKEYGYGLNPADDVGKFGNYNLMSFFGDRARRLVGINSDEMEKLCNFAVPTINTDLRSDSKYSYGYFSSMTFPGGVVVYQFTAPENCYKIELYDSNLRQNCNAGEFLDTSYFKFVSSINDDKSVLPSASIFLGPPSNLSLNQDWFYFRKKKPTEGLISDISAEDYKKLTEEISCSKVVTLVVSSSKVENISLNTSQTAFTESKNPMRNLDKVALRTEEWLCSKDSISQLGEKNNGLYDLTSGTILGNTVVLDNSKTPILELKKKILSMTSEKFSLGHTYSKGDQVLSSGKSYTSVADNNVGNYPEISPTWVLSDKFSGSFTRRFDLILDPSYSGKLSKTYIINSGKSDDYIVTYFSVTGYSISSGSNPIPELKLGEDYTMNVYKDNTTGVTSAQFNFKQSGVDKGIKLGKLTISPTVKKKLTHVRAMYLGNLYPFTLGTYYGLTSIPGVKSPVVKIKGIGITTNTVMDFETDNPDIKDVELDLSEVISDSIKVDKVEATRTLSDLSKSTEYLTKVSSGLFRDSSVSVETTYTIFLSDVTNKAKVYYNTEEWEVEDPCPEVIYGQHILVRFWSSIGITGISGKDPVGYTIDYQGLNSEQYAAINLVMIGGIYNLYIPAVKNPVRIYIKKK